MHIVVCVKSVPDTSLVRFDPETKTMIRAGVDTIVNPFDMYAIEEALRLKQAHGGSVTALSMGPPAAERELRDALALGCDAAILLSDRAFAGADTWATANTLSAAIRKLAPVDLVLCGKQAADGDTGQVGPGVAKQLGWAQLTYVSRIRSLDPGGKRLVVDRLLEDGRQLVSSPLPAVLTVLKDINNPRYPTLRGIRRAKRASLGCWGAADLAVDSALLGLSGSPTKVIRVFTPAPRDTSAEMLDGQDPSRAAEALVARLFAKRLI